MQVKFVINFSKKKRVLAAGSRTTEQLYRSLYEYESFSFDCTKVRGFRIAFEVEKHP